ncbi:DNA-binding protein [Hymenobacter sp. BT18]|uniref:PPC domain-containing DNA-binding protein n=1 Tax=Hymenobacter sp. BT18 TaxID=2835648 RepID=UPI00143E7BF7|nr:PPC domain-containing DNA-binding protein [Hymenobacter sp. BT18]QIX61032.1 DNA-binding protein [Hymenobacter sp. BT18]
MPHYFRKPAAWLLSGLLLGSTGALAQTPAPVAMPAPASSLRTYALRLHPGDDLRLALQRFVEQHQLRAAAVLTCVGSLTTVSLRLANQTGASTRQGHFEIVSLVGTLAVSGSHLHLAVADSTGQMTGGHLLEGNKVYTTAELVIGELPELEFRRETDPVSTYQELSIYPRRAPKTGKRKNTE